MLCLIIKRGCVTVGQRGPRVAKSGTMVQPQPISVVPFLPPPPPPSHPLVRLPPPSSTTTTTATHSATPNQVSGRPPPRSRLTQSQARSGTRSTRTRTTTPAVDVKVNFTWVSADFPESAYSSCSLGGVFRSRKVSFPELALTTIYLDSVPK